MKQVFRLEDDMFVKLDFDSKSFSVAEEEVNLDENNVFTVLRESNVVELTRLHKQLGLMLEEYKEKGDNV